IGAVILDNSIISKNCLVAAGAVVPPNKVYSENSLIMGNPAKEIRKLSDSEIHAISENTKRYLAYKDIYLDMKID
ncbi:MAG: gamma carbonic anhydrase family protein, partial [Deferribacterales bacterium]|nr:gamma carbonic anhydrase family protein [Deferribacterales bacterium]